MFEVRSSHAVLVAAAASWGLGTVLTKYALGGFEPALLLPFQLLVSVLLLWIFILITRPTVSGMEGIGRVAWLGVLNPGVAYALGLLGLSKIDASVSVIIWATEPLLIVLLAFLLLRETIAVYALACLGVAMLGVVLVVGSPSNGASSVGVVLTFLAVLACACYSILLRRMRLTDGTLSVVFVQQASALTFAVVTAAIAGGFRLPSETPSLLQTGSAILGGALYYGVAFLFYVAGLRRTSAARAGMFLTLIPVFGLFFSALLLHESLSVSEALGAVVVILAMGFLSLVDDRRSLSR